MADSGDGNGGARFVLAPRRRVLVPCLENRKLGSAVGPTSTECGGRNLNFCTHSHPSLLSDITTLSKSLAFSGHAIGLPVEHSFHISFVALLAMSAATAYIMSVTALALQSSHLLIFAQFLLLLESIRPLDSVVHQSLMGSQPKPSSFDFSPVLDLLKALSSTQDAAPRDNSTLDPPPTDVQTNRKSAGLGDFSDLWKYLEVPHDLPAPALPAQNASQGINNQAAQGENKAYASDGAVGPTPGSKTVQWDGALQGAGLTDSSIDQDGLALPYPLPFDDAEEEPNVAPSPSRTPSKKQAKKKKQQQRKQKGKQRASTDGEISDRDQRKPAKTPPAKKASVHQLPDSSQRLPMKKPELQSKSKPTGGAKK